jgi:hypothetical protein
MKAADWICVFFFAVATAIFFAVVWDAYHTRFRCIDGELWMFRGEQIRNLGSLCVEPETRD